MPKFNPDDYVDVAERIRRFWKDYPDGRIVTRLESLPDQFERVVFSASVFKDSGVDRVPDATGWAAEIRGETYADGANLTSWHENCETSAIGRALANLGFVTTNEPRPSRQEMEKVGRLSPNVVTSPSPGPLPHFRRS